MAKKWVWSLDGSAGGFGPTIRPDGVQFTVWAPKAETVDVELFEASGRVRGQWRLRAGPDGVHQGVVPGVTAGIRYRYRLDGGASYPDPWSRSQPDGVHGASEVVDLDAFPWTDVTWRGLDRDRLIIYEVHVGTYTPDGTFDALAAELPELQRLGVTAIELMPVAEFPGRRNWGYDGVYLYAPYHGYGGSAGLQRLVDAAHRRGLGVLLDVVYNHLGPEGNYLRAFADDFFTDRYATPWGDAINFDGPNSQYVRAFVIQNACYWLRSYHLDGLRLDATHALFDQSPTHLLAELGEVVRQAAGSERSVVLIAEDARNDVRLIRPREQGGLGLDGVWADDFHHAVHVLLTGEREGYYVDYGGTAEEVARTIASGFLYQGELSPYRGAERGTLVTDEPASAFVFCLQNHDQVGNRAFGERLSSLVSPEAYAVASALLLLAPQTPLLFMGQEFAASSPFLFFCDHSPALGALVTQGRRREFARFSAFDDPRRRDQIPDPQAEETFRRSKLDLSERQRHPGVYALYQELLTLRRGDPVLCQPDRRRTRAVAIGERAVAIYRWNECGERLILANFGPPIKKQAVRAALPPEWLDRPWSVALSTREPRFGLGSVLPVVGEVEVPGPDGIPATCALVLARTFPA